MKTKTMSTSLLLLILIIAAVIFFFTKKERELEKESMNWLSTEGTVSSSKVNRISEKIGGKVEVSFLFELQYNYEVEGQTYVGKRYKFYADPAFKNKEEAERLVTNYSVGKKITVYYQPDDPQQAVVKR